MRRGGSDSRPRSSTPPSGGRRGPPQCSGAERNKGRRTIEPEVQSGLLLCCFYGHKFDLLVDFFNVSSTKLQLLLLEYSLKHLFLLKLVMKQ